MIDLSSLTMLHTSHENAIARHLIHHPEDERHPLMAMLAEALESLADAPSYVADEHKTERDSYMIGARFDKRMGRNPSDLVHLARLHNHLAIAARRATPHN